VRIVTVEKAVCTLMNTKDCLKVLAIWMEEALVFNDIPQYNRLQTLKKILQLAKSNEN
jgi:hypothetical protein